MQKAFERVLGREYRVVIEEELKKLKQSERLLVGEPCAVLHRTDINLGRPAEECEKEDKSCYIVFLPSKYSIVCNKDFESFTSKDGNIKLISLNYLLENLLEFNFTFLQLVEPKAIIWASSEFIDIIKNYNRTVELNTDLLTIRYTKLANIAISIYGDIKSGKIKNEDACANRLFLLYIVSNCCKKLDILNSFELNSVFNIDEYSTIKYRYNTNKNLDIIKNTIEDIKKSGKLNENRDKAFERLCKLQVKFVLIKDLVTKLLVNEYVEV